MSKTVAPTWLGQQLQQLGGSAWAISNCQGGGKPPLGNGASFLFFEEFFVELFLRARVTAVVISRAYTPDSSLQVRRLFALWRDT
jgi:hypothetical protein